MLLKTYTVEKGMYTLRKKVWIMKESKIKAKINRGVKNEDRGGKVQEQCRILWKRLLEAVDKCLSEQRAKLYIKLYGGQMYYGYGNPKKV